MAVTTKTISEALPYHIPPEWSKTTAYNIAQDFQFVLDQMALLKASIPASTSTVVTVTSASRQVAPFFAEYTPDDSDGMGWIPGPRGVEGPTGPTGPAGTGGGGGAAMPFTPEYAPDDADVFPIPFGTGPQGAVGATGPQGPAGTGGGGGVAMPFFPEYVEEDAGDLPILPGMATTSSIQTAAATVSWGTPSGLTLDADFTFTTDGLVVLYNTVSQGGTFKINGSVIGGVATNQSSTCAFPYSSGQTGHVVSGGVGSGLQAAFYPFTGGCGWGTPVTLTVSSSFSQTQSGLVLIYNSNNQASTYTMGGTNYAETSTDANDSIGVPYIAGQTAVVTGGGAGTGLVATFYPFTGNGNWVAPVSLTANANFTETASGLTIGYNSGNQGATIFENGLNVGGTFNSGHHTGAVPYTNGQTGQWTTVGGTGFLAWFFALPTAGSSSGGSGGGGGGNFSTNVTTSTVGTPVVFADTSGKLGTTTTNELVIVGAGIPQGNVAASVGRQYRDTNTGFLWFKRGGGTTAYGWYRMLFPGSGMGGTGQAYEVFPSQGAATFANPNSTGVMNPATSTGAAPFTVANAVSGTRTTVNGRVYQVVTGSASSGVATSATAPLGTTSNDYLLLDGDFDLVLDLLTGATITSVRFWFAVTSVAIANTDTLGSTNNGAVGIRFSTVVPDAGFVGFTNNAVGGVGGGSSTTASLGSVATSTEYRLRIRFVRAGTPTVYFSVNDGTEASLTANIPATGFVMVPGMGWAPQTASARAFGWCYMGATIGS